MRESFRRKVVAYGIYDTKNIGGFMIVQLTQ